MAAAAAGLDLGAENTFADRWLQLTGGLQLDGTANDWSARPSDGETGAVRTGFHPAMCGCPGENFHSQALGTDRLWRFSSRFGARIHLLRRLYRRGSVHRRRLCFGARLAL